MRKELAHEIFSIMIAKCTVPKIYSSINTCKEFQLTYQYEDSLSLQMNDH